jgi:hypothetical protein
MKHARVLAYAVAALLLLPAPALAGETLRTLLRQSDVAIEAVQTHLQGLSTDERNRQVTDLERKQMGLLWRLAAHATPVTEAELIPVGHAAFEPVPFAGQNSLLAFRQFKKVFYRDAEGRIGGYNDQRMAWLTGPGYYVVNSDDEHGAYIDYRTVPTEKPDGWPRIRINERGFSRFVYGNMVDYLRRVDDGVYIGRAVRKGKETENYFILAAPPGFAGMTNGK